MCKCLRDFISIGSCNYLRVVLCIRPVVYVKLMNYSNDNEHFVYSYYLIFHFHTSFTRNIKFFTAKQMHTLIKRNIHYIVITYQPFFTIHNGSWYGNFEFTYNVVSQPPYLNPEKLYGSQDAKFLFKVFPIIFQCSFC